MGFTFEFDEAKSKANLGKHGIDFIGAQGLWLDEDLLEIPARSEAEQRFLYVGMIDGQLWSAITTHRGNRIRLISVRRSRKREARAYEGDRVG
ncbi:MAG: BrnT family toxin [Coriobacteriia bacterium]